MKLHMSKHTYRVLHEIALKHTCSIEEAFNRLIHTKYQPPTNAVCMPSIGHDEAESAEVGPVNNHEIAALAYELRTLPAVRTTLTTAIVEALTHGKRTVKEDTYGIADVLIEANKDSVD